jgi:hypothetical protein
MKLPKKLSKYRLSTINHWEHKSYAPPGKFTLWMTDWLNDWLNEWLISVNFRHHHNSVKWNFTLKMVLKIPDLFLVLNMISLAFAALTREISCSTLEINLVFPRTHACIILYIILLFNRPFLTMSLDTTACFFKVRSFKDRKNSKT